MKYLLKSALLVALALAGVAACDDGMTDGDGDVDCVDGPADQWGNCPDGGGDADSDSDGDADGDLGETTIKVETWTIGPDGTERELRGATAELRSNARTCPETPCDLTEVSLGEHVLILTLPGGWIQEPIHLAVTPDGVELREENPAFASIVLIEDRTISVRLERDITGTWRNDRGAESEVSAGTPRYPPVCPNSALVARGDALLVSILCLEGETVSLCETYAQECYDGGLTVISGVIEENRMSFRSCNIYDPEECGEVLLTRVD